MLNLEFPFRPAERRQFQDGSLARGWAERFPHLFSAADLQIALNQPQYHFYEWFVSVRLYSDYGYVSLAETYQFKRHVEAHERFRALVGPEIANLLDWSVATDRTQGPDLLTHDPETGEWFFVEVKGPRDQLRAKQITLFQKIESLSGKPVRTARCWPVHAPPPA